MKLTDVNGIGTARARMIMDEFGSIDNIRRATAEELAEIDGVTVELGTEILELVKKPKPETEDEEEISFVQWRRNHYKR